MKFETGKWSIKQLLQLVAGGEMVLQPDFQRFYIWDVAKERGLIDSILRDYPMPPVWVWHHEGEDGDSVYELIDGQQRITCIRRYLANEYEFKRQKEADNFQDLSEAEGCFFDKSPSGGKVLPRQYASAIRRYTVPFVEVQTESRAEIIDIFRRLNKSSTNLNPQEMRNAFYTGKFKSCAYALAARYQDDIFWGKHRVFSRPTTDRMSNQQFVSDLMVAMMESEAQHQSQKLDEYYEDFDACFKQQAEIEKRFHVATRFIKEMLPDISRFTRNQADFYTLFLYVDELLGRDNFRAPGNRKRIRDALKDFEVSYAEYNDRRGEKPNASSLFERYRETIVGRQREKEVREARKSIVRNLVEPGIEFKDRDSQRHFTDEQRNYLWQTSEDRRCGLCGEAITSYDDFEPDHIEPWIEGGPTSIANGQLAHVSCNRRKGANRTKLKIQKG